MLTRVIVPFSILNAISKEMLLKFVNLFRTWKTPQSRVFIFLKTSDKLLYSINSLSSKEKQPSLRKVLNVWTILISTFWPVTELT
jgi:hypothetical protein